MCKDCGCEIAGLEAHEKLHTHNHGGDHTHTHADGYPHEHTHTHVDNYEHTHSHDLEHTHGARHSHTHALDHHHDDQRAFATNFEESLPYEKSRRIKMEHAILSKNNFIAANNRKWFTEHNVRALNMISSPGSGKTLLLEKTVVAMKDRIRMSILTGDQEMDFDAQRLAKYGASVKQLNTRSSCHLEASMIHRELDQFVKNDLNLLVIENVGNLVCPAAFDLGEHEKIALLSTTEGEDKPSKYPLLFHEATVIIVTKMDLVPHLDWNQNLCEKHIRKVNRLAPIIYLSAKSGEGLNAWLSYLQQGFLNFEGKKSI